MMRAGLYSDVYKLAMTLLTGEYFPRQRMLSSEAFGHVRNRYFYFMKHVLIFAAFIFSAVASFAQDTLLFEMGNPWSSIKDRDGAYLRKAVHTDSGWLTLDYNMDNILVARSYFSDTNFTTRLHRHCYYNEKKGYLQQVKTFKDGKLDGIWAGFSATGDTLWRNTMAKGVVADSKNFTDTPGNSEFMPVQQEAMFPGGLKEWAAFIITNITTPPDIKPGEVIRVPVSFTIDKTGKVIDVRVDTSGNPVCDNAAIALIRLSPRWTPGMQNGRPVFSRKKQVITFTSD
jgi:hypothetical protein